MRLPSTLLAMALLALALGACGGGDDSGSDETSAAGAPAETRADDAALREEYEERQRAEIPTEDEQEAKEQAQGFYDVLAEDTAKDPNYTEIDLESFCDLMSEEAQEQTIEYAKRSSGLAREWDCESAVELLVLRTKRFGGFKDATAAKVIGVNAEGDRATATIRFGDGVATSVPLVKEDGEWKLAAAAVGGGSGE